MDSSEKNFFTRLNNSNSYFNTLIEKITLNDALTFEENAYSLSLSLLFAEEYIKSQKVAYFEFSYYLVLTYALRTADYAPLLDFAFNNGFYPIARSIMSNNKDNIITAILNTGLERFAANNKIELKEQKEKIENLLSSAIPSRAFIAPTSYGKSSFIADDIKKHKASAIGIIVPKKALIWQTFRNIKEIARELSYKVLLHDTEYYGETRFIGVFTQERATRLLQDQNTHFDILYIDEAHNLFEKDERNILLARLIKLNRKLNPEQKVVYLSPLINDINNIKTKDSELIDVQKIDFNIKEYDIKLYEKSKKCLAYNRFVDNFYNLNHNYKNAFDFINGTAKEKNLIYLNRPKDIEYLAKLLIKILPVIDKLEIKEISDMIEKYVDKDYLMRELVLRGAIYIHSKVPDSIKDYLLEKFKTCNSIKFLVSNSSVLEGVNFPIDCIFILDAYSMRGSDLKNLCGRVNRLNEIFTAPARLDKLLCPIYFVETKRLGDKTNFRNKIKLLRCNDEDEVQNPLLVSSKMEVSKRNEILSRENSYIDNYSIKSIKNILVKNSVNYFYKNIDKCVFAIENRISLTKQINNIGRLIDLIVSIFIDPFNIDEFQDYELSRLRSIQAQNSYKNYLNGIYYSDIKTKIKYFLNHFKKIEGSNIPLYIGEAFGESKYRSNIYEGTREAYVYIANKGYAERVNLAVIKSKIEDDFISYKLTRLVKALLDFELITESVYNEFLYNTDDKTVIEMINAGFGYQLISFILENNLENDIVLEETGFKVTDNFRGVLQEQDDFIKFEIGKFI